MKKISLALLAATAFTASTAMASNGFYLGASAGVAQTNAGYNWAGQNVVAPSGAPFPAGAYQHSFKNNSGKAAGLFGLFAGYGAVIGNGAYVGGEIYGGFDTTSFSPYDDSASGQVVGLHKAKLERKYYYGLAARLGYMITPSTLAYIRLAIESGKWKASVTPDQGMFAAAQSNPPAGYTYNAAQAAQDMKTVTASKTGIQFAPGMGVEIFVTKNLFLRAEYSYLFGPKLTVVQGISSLPNTTSGQSGTSNVHSFKTSQHAMKIGVGYKF